MDPAQELEARVLSQQQPMLAAMGRGQSEVQRFYSNCAVLLTGGSGFLGKQLAHKLLRCCQVSKVYMLLRPKKDKGIHERLCDILKDPVFDVVRKNQPEFGEKIIPVNGDISEIRLGLDDRDWKTLTEEVDVIFHVAATVRFDEPLRTATLINVRGTREVLLLGKACKKLRSIVHVSTAYCHATRPLIQQDVREEFCRSPVPPEALISMAETMDQDRLSSITAGLIKDWPNTYTFTKAVAEEQVRILSDGLPICIVRPAVVLGTYREPAPGWIDTSCLYGILGLILGSGLGISHVSILDLEKNAGFIPCDYVNNAIIVAARETASSQAKGGDHTKIYTVCSTQDNPVTYGVLVDTLETKARSYITPKAVYYSFSLYVTSKTLFAICTIFFMVIPAYVADMVCIVMGKPMRFARLMKKLPNIFNVVSYFTLNEWNFKSDNLNKLYRGLSNQDRAIFNFDVKTIDWVEMILVQCVGLRKYIIKDGINTTAYAIRKQKYLRVAHYFFVTLYGYCLWKIFHYIFSMGSALISALRYYV